MVGSYVLKTLVNSDTALPVDMVVIMPASIFQEKDYLNYRYFYKRAYYLACIAAGLQNDTQMSFSIKYEYLHGNSLLPILSLKPTASKSNAEPLYEIRIIPASPTAFFAESKLRPEKNAIRPKERPEVDSTSLQPTPFYNASLRSDSNYETYLKLLHSSTNLSSGFKDSCILGRIWLRQRGFGSSLAQGGFGHFEWSALTALLLKGGGPKGHNILSPGYSSYQMFKAFLQFLSSNDLASKPFLFEAKGVEISRSGLPMFYDGPRGQNILYKMTPWSYAMLQDEAKVSLDMLNNATFDQFESTFIIRTSQPTVRYDCLFRLSPTDASEKHSCDHISKSGRFEQRLYQTLKEGLTDRVKLINLRGKDSPSWHIKSSEPSSIEVSSLVSVVFDPANIDRLVDHGPAAEEKKKAANFQKFWGDKAELRRFKDGSILESLVWAPGTAHGVFEQIVSYLIERHFGAEIGTSIEFHGEGFEKLLPGSSSSTKNFDNLRQTFSKFEKQFRDLEGLPLQLRQLSAASPQLRYSSIESPSISSRQPLRQPADVLIQFEGSGRWPDDVTAIQRTKIAFLLKIGALLEEVDNTITSRVGLENEDRPLENCAFLDIIYESGAAFRLRIHNDREATLLERQVKDKSSDQHSREAAASALSIYKRTFIQIPLLTQSISTHCTRFPLLSPTIRLVKMWFDRHMLSSHVSEELIELLVAHTFLQAYPWRAPSSVMTGFLRTLLFISRWDWRSVPLVVDFTGTMTSKDVEAVNTRLEAWRKIDPSMSRTVLFAASNHDMTGTAFTDAGPSKMVAARMTALARSACKLVKDKGLDLDHRSLFTASTADYDFVIHIAPKFTEDPQRKQSSSSKFKNLEIQAVSSTDLVGYSPVQLYLEELRNVYTNTLVLFHGSAVGSVIAGLWNPQSAAARPFKVNLAYATKAVEGSEEEIVLDKEAILSEMARLGRDMVSRIEVNR